jgi:serine/threonine protein kinase
VKQELTRANARGQLGNYELIRLLGKGGFAKVYLGEHIYLDTEVAVKVLNTWLADDEAEHFHAEARLMAHLRHRNIVRVLDFGVERNIPFLIMEYASNGTLRQHFPRGIALQLNTLLPYIMQIADGLQYVHSRNLIHCDIKPENLLLGPGNEVWLSDFGIAVAARTGDDQEKQESRGTAAYMAPEQILGRPVPASDQYALAVIVYEWLCGELPFHGSTLQLHSQHLYTTPPRLRKRVPAISPAVEYVVLKALAKDPSQRYANVKEFALALAQACQKERPLVLHIPASNVVREDITSSYSTRRAVGMGRMSL